MPVGREAELQRVALLIAQDAPVLVLGEAGVGKTTVLRAAARDSGRQVFEGGALSTLSWSDYLALERAFGRPMVHGDPTAVVHDVETAVGNALLLVDDLHWASAATLDVVTQLAHRVAVLAGVRAGDPGTGRAIERLSAAGFAVVELRGLDDAQATRLVRDLHADLGPGRLERLLARAGGNPLLLRELAVTGEPSASLRLALAARLRQLDAGGREAFDLLALAGRPVPVAALGDAGVKSLLGADLAVLGPAGVEVRHALLAEVAVGQMAPDERRARHALIARSVDDPGESARHHALAGEPELAYEAAMLAVQRTSRPAERASHLAVAAAAASGPEADTLRLQAASSLEAVHDWDAMIATLDRLDPANRPAQAAACLLRARGAWSAGDAEGLRRSLAQGLALAGGTGSDIEVRLRIEQSRVPLFVDSDFEAGLAAASSALELARRSGVEVPRARYLYGTALALLGTGDAVTQLRCAMEAARAADDVTTEFLAVINLISTLESGDDPAMARALCREYIERAREVGLGEWEQIIRSALTSLDLHAGQYQRVLIEAEDLLARKIDRRAQDQVLEALGLALVDLGRIDEALRRLDAAEATMAQDFRGSMQAAYVRIEAALWGGRPADALRLADEFLATSPENDWNTLFGHTSRAWACYDLGLDPGAGLPEQGRAMLQAMQIEVDGVRALYAAEFEAATSAFRSAGRLWATYQHRSDLRCRWALGETLRRGGDVVGAIRVLEDAEQLAQRHGMLPVLGRIHRSLRAAGVRRTTPRTRSAGSILTDRQTEVLRLVAEGLTNAQIATRLGVSRHTVVTQLSTATAKLGASSRAQAASLAATARTAR